MDSGSEPTEDPADSGARLVIDLAEAAYVLGCDQRTVRSMIEREGLPVLQLGGPGQPYEFDGAAVVAWGKSRKATLERARAAEAEEQRQLRLELLGGQSFMDASALGASAGDQRALIELQLAMHKLGDLRRALIRCPEVHAGVESWITRVRQDVGQIPGRLRADLFSPADRLALADALAAAVDKWAAELRAAIRPEPRPRPRLVTE